MRSFLQPGGILRSERAINIVQLLAGAVAISLVFWKLQFSTGAICCGDFDGYYHIKWSRLLWEGVRTHHFPPVFTWLPLTTLNPKNYVDHHLLFHFFQMAFTWLADLRMSAKISATIFASIAVFSCYWLLARYHIRFLLIWLVALLACSAPFLYRLNMAKAPPFAIIYLVIGIHLLFQKRFWLLLPLAAIFTLTYDMFPALLLACCIWVAITGWVERRFEWRPLAWVLAGIAAGLILNPYFPQNLHLFYEHLAMKVRAAEYATKVGQEWYPYDSWEFLGNSLVACIAMFVGYVAFNPTDGKRTPHALFFLLFATALMIMTARWKRIAEYWPPFAVMFCAFALQPWLKRGPTPVGSLPADVLDELQPYLDRHEPLDWIKETERKELWKTIGAAIVATLLGIALFFNLQVTIKDIAMSEPHNYYRAGAEWMKANVPAGQRIFNTDWDDFPRLFYYDPNHSYISGLDPNYLYDEDASLSRLYDRITLGDQDDPGPLIRDRFGARFIFTDNGHDRFYSVAMESGWFEIVYEDEDCTILHIRDERSVPAPDETEAPSTDVKPSQ